MKHTPGPWHIESGKHCGMTFFWLENDEGRFVCWGACDASYLTEERRATIHILSVAPEMLKALHQVEWVKYTHRLPDQPGTTITWRECPWCGGDQELGHEPDCIRQAVIAKAEDNG